MTERSIAATIHGRYLTEHPKTQPTGKLIVGFHGYAENAEIQMERLVAIPESSDWSKLSIQGLHRFYQRRTNLVVSSWMTSQDRNMAIADNLAYVRACVQAVAAESGGISEVIFAGFSQGVAMAFRAAVTAEWPVNSVVAVGGDVPPELHRIDLARIPAVTMVRGIRDEWYTAEKFDNDKQRLTEAGVSLHTPECAGAHEWPAGLISLARSHA